MLVQLTVDSTMSIGLMFKGSCFDLLAFLVSTLLTQLTVCFVSQPVPQSGTGDTSEPTYASKGDTVSVAFVKGRNLTGA